MTADARAGTGGAVAMVRSAALTIAIGALVLAGCGPHGVEGAPVDATIADAFECADGESTCGGRCVDTGWDPLHCGACDVTCSGDTDSCGAGRCMASGATIWERHYGAGHVRSVAIDRAGNVYIAGAFRDTIDLGGGPLTSAGGADLVIASFSPRGAHRWSRRIGGAGEERVGDLAVVATDGEARSRSVSSSTSSAGTCRRSTSGAASRPASA